MWCVCSLGTVSVDHVVHDVSARRDLDAQVATGVSLVCADNVSGTLTRVKNGCEFEGVIVSCASSREFLPLPAVLFLPTIPWRWSWERLSNAKEKVVVLMRLLIQSNVKGAEAAVYMKNSPVEPELLLVIFFRAKVQHRTVG